MKYKYLIASFLIGILSHQALGQVTAWRLFRPGLVYHFQNSNADSLYTLRLDSAYVTGTDSVFTFNRVMRRGGNGYYFVKSRNNQFGARLVLRPAGEMLLQLQAETGNANVPAVMGTSLSLRPRAAVGSNWVATGTITATLSSRTIQTLAGSTTDSVAVITLSDGRVLEVSRRFGLVAAPRLLTGTSIRRQLRLHRLPRPITEYTAPTDIYNFQPGDEFGYTDRSQITAGAACTSYKTLTRILTRQQTADSLIYTQISQTVYTQNEYSYCPGPKTTTLYPTYGQRVAYALRPAVNNGGDVSNLLTYGYRAVSALSGSQFMLLPTVQATSCGTTRYLSTVFIMQGQSSFTPLSDYPEVAQLETGLGSTRAGSRLLTYYYKHTANGTSIVCGTNAEYNNLLPTRAEQAARAATLAPNPATIESTLTLAAPAVAGTTLVLVDALGRQVWRTPVAANQTVLPIPLASQPTGLYLVQLLTPGAAPLTWKLQH